MDWESQPEKTLMFGAQIDVTDVRQILEKFGKSCEKVHRNMAEFNKLIRKISRGVLQAYYMGCVKFCHSPPYFLYWMAHFSHTPRQISPDSDLTVLTPGLNCKC